MSKPENQNDVLKNLMLTAKAKTRISVSEIDDTMNATAIKKLAKKGIRPPRISKRVEGRGGSGYGQRLAAALREQEAARERARDAAAATPNPQPMTFNPFLDPGAEGGPPADEPTGTPMTYNPFLEPGAEGGPSRTACGSGYSSWNASGKNCPSNDASCLNSNIGYGTVAEATTKCNSVAGCGGIFSHPNGKYHLRRATDPDRGGSANGFCTRDSPTPHPSGTIINPPESSRTYSSVYRDHEPGWGYASSMIDSGSAWAAKTNDTSQWMKIDAGSPTTVAGIKMQPRKGSSSACCSGSTWQYVKTFKVKASEISTSSGNWVENGKIFTTSSGSSESMFTTPITARYFIIYPQTWNDHMSMRAGLIAGDVAAPAPPVNTPPVNTPPAPSGYTITGNPNTSGYCVPPFLGAAGYRTETEAFQQCSADASCTHVSLAKNPRASDSKYWSALSTSTSCTPETAGDQLVYTNYQKSSGGTPPANTGRSACGSGYSSWNGLGKSCPPALLALALCLNSNIAYGTVAEATTKCNSLTDCGGVYAHSNGKYYLRRATDPDIVGSANNFCTKGAAPAAPSGYTIVGNPKTSGHCVLPWGTGGSPTYRTPAEAFQICSNDASCTHVSLFKEGRVSDSKYWSATSTSTICTPTTDPYALTYTNYQKSSEGPGRSACGSGYSSWNALGKRCPHAFAGGCLNSNIGYGTVAEATTKCNSLTACGGVYAYPNGKYYLRRATDPNVAGNTNNFCTKGAATAPSVAYSMHLNQLYQRPSSTGPALEHLPSTTLEATKAACTAHAECDSFQYKPAPSGVDGTGFLFRVRRAKGDDTFQEWYNSVTWRNDQDSNDTWTFYYDATGATPAGTGRSVCGSGYSQWIHSGKDCPSNNASCLNSNTGYSTVAEATTQCNSVADCGGVFSHTNGEYYLRRSSDPDIVGSANNFCSKGGRSPRAATPVTYSMHLNRLYQRPSSTGPALGNVFPSVTLEQMKAACTAHAECDSFQYKPGSGGGPGTGYLFRVRVAKGDDTFQTWYDSVTWRNDQDSNDTWTFYYDATGATPPVAISSAAEAARSWSQTRVRLATARSLMVCTKSEAQKATDLVLPISTMSTAAKDARYEMFEDLRNPILRNVIMNPSGTDLVAGETLMGPTTVNQSGIGWLRIPTSNINQIEGSWSASDGLNTDPVDHASPNSFITFLIAKKYTADESKNIFNALNQGSNRLPAPKLSDGRGFIFTKEGHIKLWLTADSTAKPTMFNPFINRAVASSTTDATGDPSVNDRLQMATKTDNSYTMAGGNEEQGVQNYSTWSRGSLGPLFAMSTKVVMNKTLNYILYTPTPVPTETSRYYLLYNPIHGQEFRKFYQSLLQSDNPSGGGATSAAVNVPSISDPQFSTDVRVYDKHQCLKSVNTPAYTKIIGKYCNAFKLAGQVTRGSTLNHYADPLCQIMMSEMGSGLYYALQTNVTNESLRTKFYKNRHTDTFREGYLQYLAAKSSFKGGTSEFSKMTWACPDHNVTGTDPNIQNYMNEAKLYAGTNPSFVQILGHSLVNSNQQWRTATVANIQSIGRRTTEQDTTFTRMTTPACFIPSITITSCKTTIDVEGNIIDSNVVQQNYCGPRSTVTVPAGGGGGGGGGCTPGSSSCPTAPHDCKTATGGKVVEDTQGRKRYTKCCYADNTTAIITDCPVDDDGATLVQSTYGAQNPTAPEHREITTAAYTLSISEAVEKLNKAGKAADAATTAYPTDLIITAASDEVLDGITAAKADATALTTRVDGVTSATSQPDIVTIGTDIDTLIDDTAAVDKLKSDLVILIAKTYMFGVKKLYLIGGAIGLVVLIILILLIKK